ncbi:MAG: aldehyde dehydrogenase family protein [Rhizomicrobium sp.]
MRHRLFERAIEKFGAAPANLSQVVLGLRDAGEQLAKNTRIPVVSATGSTRMGRELAPVVAARFGKSILELGGNNAMIVTPSAKLNLAQTRDPVRRCRHRGPALHIAAPPVRA